MLDNDDEEYDDGQGSSGIQFTSPKKKRASGRPRKSMMPYESTEELTVQLPIMDEEQSCGLHMTTMQVSTTGSLLYCGVSKNYGSIVLTVGNY